MSFSIPAADLTAGKIAGTTISVSGNDSSSLTLTGTSSTTTAQFKNALDEVQFDAASPNNGTRTLTWMVNDDAGGNPTTAIRSRPPSTSRSGRRSRPWSGQR